MGDADPTPRTGFWDRAYLLGQILSGVWAALVVVGSFVALADEPTSNPWFVPVAVLAAGGPYVVVRVLWWLARGK